jgi:uncharacterized membrane protein
VAIVVVGLGTGILKHKKFIKRKNAVYVIYACLISLVATVFIVKWKNTTTAPSVSVTTNGNNSPAVGQNDGNITYK